MPSSKRKDLGMNFDELTEEQKEKFSKCKTLDEMLEQAQEEGFELSEEELDGIAGAGWSTFCDDYTYPYKEG